MSYLKALGLQCTLVYLPVIGLGVVKREYLRAFGFQRNRLLVIVFVEIRETMYGES